MYLMYSIPTSKKWIAPKTLLKKWISRRDFPANKTKMLK